jgi:hypothetical protein
VSFFLLWQKNKVCCVVDCYSKTIYIHIKWSGMCITHRWRRRLSITTSCRSLTTRLTTLKLPIVSSNRCLVDRTISRSSLSTDVLCSLVVPARNNDLALAERRKCTALAHTTLAHLFWSPFFFVTKHYCLPSTLWTITCWDNAPVKSCSVLFTSRPYPITLSQVVRNSSLLTWVHDQWWAHRVTC